MGFNYWQKFEENEIYHIYNRSVEFRNLFEEVEDFHFFLQKIKKYLLPYLNIYAYCLMPNHFHLLVEVIPFYKINKSQLQKENSKAANKLLKEGTSCLNAFLEDQMRRLFSSHSLHCNKKYKVRGALFQARFKRVQVYGFQNILSKLAYIHHNPIHHGFRTSYLDWPYSTYHSYFSNDGQELPQITFLEWLGGGDLEVGIRVFYNFHQNYQLGKKEDWHID